MESKYNIIMKRLENISQETIDSINNQLKESRDREKLIQQRVDSKDFNLEELFNIFFNREDSISNESIGYFPENYQSDKYKDIQLELDVVCAFILLQTELYKLINPPFYQDTMFGQDIYFKFNNELYHYYCMHGQGTIEGICKGDNENREVLYCLNLNNFEVERIIQRDRGIKQIF